MNWCHSSLCGRRHRGATYLTPSRPRPNTRSRMPRSWCPIWPQLWGTCTASTSSTEMSNRRTCWWVHASVPSSLNPASGFNPARVLFSGVWGSGRHQVSETGWLWSGHCGGGASVYRVWNSNLRCSWNHCRVWVSSSLQIHRWQLEGIRTSV